MKLIIDIDEDTYKDIIKNGFIYDEDNEAVTHVIKNGTPIPDNPTNGDVIKAMFPYIESETYGLITSVKGLDCDKRALDPYRHFWSDWWNAPYIRRWE